MGTEIVASLVLILTLSIGKENPKAIVVLLFSLAIELLLKAYLQLPGTCLICHSN